MDSATPFVFGNVPQQCRRIKPVGFPCFLSLHCGYNDKWDESSMSAVYAHETIFL